MPTRIDIKKKIAAYEEGAQINADISGIDIVGDGASASMVGDKMVITVPGGMGTITYYLNETVTQSPYKEFSSVPTSAAEQTIIASVASGATATIQSFQTVSGIPNTTNIPGGLWSFYLHLSGTSGDTWNVFVEVYKRDTLGTETLLLTTDLIPVSTLTSTPTMILTDGVLPSTTLLTTDRIVVKVKVTNTDTTTNSITLHTEGSTNYSVATTTLNQSIPAGTVSSVGATAPVQSSGGSTPVISMPQATALVDGYLSAADWLLFSYNRQIQDEGVNVTQRSTVDFQGAGVTVTDSGGKTVVTIPGSTFGKIGITNVNGEYTFYSTLSSAVAASVAGDTIVFFTNIVETGAVTVTLPDGVDINLNGFSYTLNNAGTNNSIQTSPGATNTIFNGVIDRLGGASNLTNSVALRLDSSVIYLDNVVVKSAGTGIYASDSQVYGNWTVLSSVGIYAALGFCYFKNGRITTSGGNGIEAAIQVDIINCLIQANGEGVFTNEPLTVYNSLIVAVGGSGVNTDDALTMYNSTIVSTGACVSSLTSGVFIANCVMRSLTSIAIRLFSGHTGGIILYNSSITTNTNTIVDIATTGTVEIAGNTLRSSTSSAINGIRISATSTNTFKISDNYIYVISSNVVGSCVGINVSSSSTPRIDIVNNHIEIFSTVAASRCIGGTGTVYYSSNAFRMSSGQPPVGAGITQAMVNTPDLYGNILIG